MKTNTILIVITVVLVIAAGAKINSKIQSQVTKYTIESGKECAPSILQSATTAAVDYRKTLVSQFKNIHPWFVIVKHKDEISNAVQEFFSDEKNLSVHSHTPVDSLQSLASDSSSVRTAIGLREKL